jgi:hypothetical protein
MLFDDCMLASQCLFMAEGQKCYLSRRFQLRPDLDYSGTYSDRNGINSLSLRGGAWGFGCEVWLGGSTTYHLLHFNDCHF